jgi:hypothetical protein
MSMRGEEARVVRADGNFAASGQFSLTGASAIG